MINLVPRKEIPLSLTLTTTAIAVALTLIAGAAIFGVLGYEPLAALYQFFIAPVSRGYQVADLFVKACPLIMIANGLVFSYRANGWNIGAEVLLRGLVRKDNTLGIVEGRRCIARRQRQGEHSQEGRIDSEKGLIKSRIAIRDFADSQLHVN